MPALRIVSLVPSQTELLFDLALDNEVVGITKFCVHPEHWKESKTIVGGTKNVKLDVIDSLKPDLVIANKEENTKGDVEALMKKYKVWVSDVRNVDDAYKMIRTVGDLTDKRTEADVLVSEIKNSFSEIELPKIKSALYLIWRKPWMAAGSDTFINEMMRIAGFENVVVDIRYPDLSDEQIRGLNPEFVLLSSEPYPFKEQHVDALKKLLPSSKVMLVDGEMFSWYGSRMREMAGYFEELRTTAL